MLPIQQKPAKYEVQTAQIIEASYESVWQAVGNWFRIYRLPLAVNDRQTGILSTRGQTYPNWEERIDCGSMDNKKQSLPVVKMTVSLQPVEKDKTLVTFDVWAVMAPEEKGILPGHSCVSKGILEEKFFYYLHRIEEK